MGTRRRRHAALLLRRLGLRLAHVEIHAFSRCKADLRRMADVRNHRCRHRHAAAHQLGEHRKHEPSRLRRRQRSKPGLPEDLAISEQERICHAAHRRRLRAADPSGKSRTRRGSRPRLLECRSFAGEELPTRREAPVTSKDGRIQRVQSYEPQRVFYRRQQFQLRQVHKHERRARFAVERAAELVREAMNRRRFLKQTGAAAGLTAVQGLTGAEQAVSIIVDWNDPVASTAPVSWAVSEFQAALKAQAVASGVYPRIADAPAGARYVMIAGNANAAAREVLRRAPATTLPSAAEALWTVPGTVAGKPVLLAGGNDARGLVYAVLELADRVRYSPSAMPALELRAAVIEKPANAI